MRDLEAELGRIDIYLFDQLLRRNIRPGARVLDAGCGSGRNLVYLMREGYEVFALDVNSQAIADVRSLAASLAPELPTSNFRVEPIEAMAFPDESMDVVLSSAVLHFARDDEHFRSMLESMWRVLVPGGLFFCRLGSTIGLDDRCRRIEGRRFVSPDGAERYLVDEARLVDATETLGGQLVDPLKTTVVQNQRSMTTWVVRKRPNLSSRKRRGHRHSREAS